MKKILSTSLSLAVLFGLAQTSNAANHGSNQNLTVSGVAVCSSENQGVAVVDSRNIVVNGSRQQVLHLKAQGQTAAQAFVQGSGETPITLTGPIQFTVKTGNANRLSVGLSYTEPNGTMTGNIYVTSTGKLTNLQNAKFLVNVGPGKYAIPVGPGGVPYGSTVLLLLIEQSGNPNNCSNHTSNINEIFVNKFPVGIVQSSSVCGNSCGAVEDSSPEDSND